MQRFEVEEVIRITNRQLEIILFLNEVKKLQSKNLRTGLKLVNEQL